MTTIDSSICVATMTGFPAPLHLAMICFWRRGTSQGGTSMPRSPLATMMPSEASMISSMFSMASRCSIFEMRGWSPPARSIARRLFSTSRRSRMKDMANQSPPTSTPKSMPLRSLSVGGLSVSEAPGAFTPLWLTTSPPETTRPWKPLRSSSMDVTLTSMRPSLRKRLPPTWTSRGRSP